VIKNRHKERPQRGKKQHLKVSGRKKEREGGGKAHRLPKTMYLLVERTQHLSLKNTSGRLEGGGGGGRMGSCSGQRGNYILEFVQIFFPK